MPENFNIQHAVYTFYADVTPLRSDSLRSRLYAELPDFRKEKADRLRSLNDQMLSIGAWSLLTHVRTLAGCPDDMPFNLSHSGKYVLASIGPDGRRVGCDIEMVREFREPVARRFFCPSEYESILSAPEEERADLFCRFWVLKESFLKATRLGMKLGLDSFAFQLPHTPGIQAPVLIKQPPQFPEAYYFLESGLPGRDARIAVCSDTPDIRPPRPEQIW